MIGPAMMVPQPSHEDSKVNIVYFLQILPDAIYSLSRNMFYYKTLCNMVNVYSEVSTLNSHVSIKQCADVQTNKTITSYNTYINKTLIFEYLFSALPFLLYQQE